MYTIFEFDSIIIHLKCRMVTFYLNIFDKGAWHTKIKTSVLSILFLTEELIPATSNRIFKQNIKRKTIKTCLVRN